MTNSMIVRHGQPTSSRKTIAVVQSCCIPRKGCFGLIDAVGEFILYDDEDTRRDAVKDMIVADRSGLEEDVDEDQRSTAQG